MQEKKRNKVKKGWFVVWVGQEEDEDGGFRRFTIPISYLHHPEFKKLLEKTQEVYGYDIAGPLRLPCSVDEFLHLRWHLQKEGKTAHHGHQHHQYNSLSHTFPFHYC